ncbi:MAG: sulfatase-like hydrolase/transferase [Verrucomicrobiales bacterium]
MRLRRLFLCLTAIACHAAIATAAAAAADPKPNVILMMADDMGWGDPRCFRADSPIQTPHLDAMAAAGLKFDRFYAAAPVCSPTRGACLTGRHPYRYGIYFANVGHLKPEEITLAEILRDQGYATGHFGKWHLGTFSKEIEDANRGGPKGAAHYSPPQANGFDVCFSTESKVPTYDPMLKPKGKAPGIGWDFIKDRADAAPYGTRYWNEKGEVVEDNLLGDDSRAIMDRAIPFIQNAAKADKPFFAVIWFHAPHLPVVAGPEHAALYAGDPVHARNYRGCITALDEQVGRLRQALRDAACAENTMLWFCSDNGPEGGAKDPGSAAHLRGRKRSLYEGGIRVPGILEWPAAVKGGAATVFPAVTSDYLPTVLDALGIPQLTVGRPLDGISLLPHLRGEMPERPQPIAFQSKGQLALSDNRFKLYRGGDSQAWELYDLIDDPSEKHDLAADQPERVKAMAAKALAWKESCTQSDGGGDY